MSVLKFSLFFRSGWTKEDEAEARRLTEALQNLTVKMDGRRDMVAEDKKDREDKRMEKDGRRDAEEVEMKDRGTLGMACEGFWEAIPLDVSVKSGDFWTFETDR